MTKAIAGLIIIAAVAYVLMRLTFYVAGLWTRARRAEAERDRLASDRMPLIQDKRREDDPC